MWSLQADGSLHLTGAGPNTETALDLHWENTDGVLRRVDSIPGHWPYLQYLNLEGQRVANVGALGSSLSLRELIASGNQLADVSPLSSCILLARLDLNDNCIEELPAGFRSLVMLQQLLVAGNHIKTLKTFEVLASLPALVEISVARNPVSSRACEEFLISQLRVLSTIDGQEVSHAQRQAVTMQAAKRRIEALEEQIRLQDSNIAEVNVAQQRSEGLLKGIERLIAPKVEAAAVMGPAPGLEKDTDSACQNRSEAGAVKAYLPVMVASPNLRDAGVSNAWDAGYGDTEIESGAIQRGSHVRDSVIPVPIDTASRDLSHEARQPPPAGPDIQATASSLGGPQHFRNNAGLETASHEAPPAIPAHGRSQSHAQLQTQMHTQANRNASAHGKLPPADGGVGIYGGAAADRESQLIELLSKSRHLLGAACLDQLSQNTSPLHTQRLGEGGGENLRDLVRGLLMAVVPVFEKMPPPFRGAFLVEELESYSPEEVVKVLTALLPQLSAVAFPPDDAPMHQGSRVHTDVLPRTASTPRAHEPPTPQPNRAPAPQPLNTENPRPWQFPSSLPFSVQHYSQPPLPLNGAKLHETMRGSSFAGEGHWNKAVHFATSQILQCPQGSPYDPQNHSRQYPDQQEHASQQPHAPRYYQELRQHAAGSFSECNGDRGRGKEADVVTGFPHRAQSSTSSLQRPQDIFVAQEALARAAAEAAAAEAELQAARLRVWGVSDMSRLEMSSSANMRPTPARRASCNGNSSPGPQGFSPRQHVAAWRTRDAEIETSPAALPLSSSAMPMSGVRGRRSPSPLAREIQERFQQYQQAMQRYDSSLHEANAQASAVVSRLQDTDDAAASSEWDDDIVLHGSSPPSGAVGEARTRGLAPLNKKGVARLPTAAQKAGKIMVPLSERFDRDSCHRPPNPGMAPSFKPGLELLQRKGGKGIKAKASNSR